MTAMAVASRGEGSLPGGSPRSYLRSWRSVESGKSWRDIAAPRAHPITPPTVRNDGGSDGHAPVIVTKLIVSVTNSGSVNEGAATAPGRQHCNETGRPVMKWGRATGPGCHVGDGRGATSRKCVTGESSKNQLPAPRPARRADTGLRGASAPTFASKRSGGSIPRGSTNRGG